MIYDINVSNWVQLGPVVEEFLMPSCDPMA